MFHVQLPPPLKRRRHEIPIRVQRQQERARRKEELQKALNAIEKLIRSKTHIFDAGANGLQAYRARAIQSYLTMVVKNGRKGVDTSERAAESQGFAAKWGGRLVRSWVKKWIATRTLPVSKRGQHIKVFTLLNDPTIRDEMRAFLRSNKWTMNPQKLADFTQNKLLPDEAKKYAKEVLDKEMPTGLKNYLEIELFPRVHQKVNRGISLQTARRWLRAEGFQYTEFKKGLYYDGWILEGEQPLRKKGVGRGLHQSDVICSTFGWLAGASQTLEYGKNYDGYWTGELFVKQLREKIIPEFERLHGQGFQALIMVDNSQGHSAYSKDALLTSRMNMNPGGKQARMHDGWFMSNGRRVSQPMIFPADHPEFPDAPKGMKHKYLRDNCDYTFETLKENMPKALASVPVERIRKWEHRMYRWMDAYRTGLGAKDAQAKVKQFSSRRYTFHRRVPETLARQFDQ
ncbi:uncharacterized protein EV420DRAFT_1285416 [Desarmillaria tabescens]|uniref:Uncharacterized protein n=1 Tax=Armillaria tabescens TaxID=1929756 RepID=A0AA39MF07_ARMTA|nr:uncharacterized protein EV420DRAFT_1285416 [Desarmillaria tabescens]KAK0431882.1 hypothetical protein EV420DRAFT_1285416 [Desarmillaria tabescens]